MARTIRGSKPWGYDYWSRRGDGKNPLGCWGHGKYAKRLTVRHDRIRDKRLIANGIKEVDEHD